ncbi:hypothetical protein TNCV_3415391 [Trichonephila clavipes]|nr:hypothetical protein TNCV_3415391 [Trichonephila clavipes]
MFGEGIVFTKKSCHKLKSSKGYVILGSRYPNASNNAHDWRFCIVGSSHVDNEQPPCMEAEKLLGAVDTRRYPRVENRVCSDQENHEERGSKDRMASTCGPLSDSFNGTNRRGRSNCSTNNFQTPCRSKS